MRGVQNAGDVIGLTGLYTANNFRPFKPRRSEEVNKHTYPPKTKQKIIGKENMHSLWPFRFCLLKANHLRTNQGSAMLLHKHYLNEAEGALNVALGTRKQSNSSNSMWFGRIINQQWLRLMPQSNFKLCSLWRLVLSLMSFWSTISSCVGNELLHLQNDPQPAQENIWICRASPASHQIISWGGFMGKGSVLKDS